MSPDDDEQLHSSVSRLATSSDLEMPPIQQQRGWSPVPQTDDEMPIANTPKKSTANGQHASASNHLPGASSSPTPSASPTPSTASTPPVSSPASAPSTRIANGNGSVAYHNGTSHTSPAKQAPNGNGSTSQHQHHNAADPVATNNNDLWSTAMLSGGGVAAQSSSPPRIEKNGWKELPQDELDDGQLGRAGSSGSNGNGHGIAALQTSVVVPLNAGVDKLHTAEDDPLTGVVCKDPDADDEESSSCGIGPCQPKWARMFASTKSFMFVFLIAWVLQGMYLTYVVSVLTTIEKLFQIKSKTAGILFSATEVGQISTALLLTYYAGQGHRPRWIACGMMLFAVCVFGCSIPHFLYGTQLQHASNSLHSGRNAHAIDPKASTKRMDGPYSDAQRSTSEAAILDDATTTVYLAINATKEKYLCTGHGECEMDRLEEQATHSEITKIVLVILVICMLGVGVGQTAVATLGIPFIDDNVASRESAIYIAITIGVRILGPTTGFMLGSLCTRIHVDFTDPGYGPDDPRWVGAWYLGLVIIPTLMIIAALAMFTFPKHLKGHRIPPPSKLRSIETAKKIEKRDEPVARPRLRDFPKTIRRQLSNDILMFRTASSVLHLLPVAGLYTFLPKYLESQFQMAAHQSNMITALYGILMMGVGIVVSGVVILKCSPTARSVAGYTAFAAFVYSAGMASLMFLGCSMDNFIGLTGSGAVAAPPIVAHNTLTNSTPYTMSASLQRLIGESPFRPPCNVSCDCDFGRFSPICGSDGNTYYSPCHAGCSYSMLVDGKTQYKNCECIPSNGEATFAATGGQCDSKCQSYVAFIALFSVLVFIHSTSEVGGMLLIMRCTDPRDKAMAMGIIQFAIGLFGNVPCAILYGAVIDSTCLVWDTVCGKQGACQQYDVEAFRHLMFGMTSGIMFLGFIMDLVVWRKAHRIDFDPENNASTSSNGGVANGSGTIGSVDNEKPTIGCGSSTAVGVTIVPDTTV